MVPWDKRSSLLASLWSLIGEKKHHLWSAIHGVNSFPETKYIAVWKASTSSFCLLTSQHLQALLPPSSPNKRLPTSKPRWVAVIKDPGSLDDHSFSQIYQMGTLVEAELEWVPPSAKQSFLDPGTSFVCSPRPCTSSAPRAESLCVTHSASLLPSICLVHHFFNSYTYSWAQASLRSAPHQSPSSLLFCTHSCWAILRAPNADTATPLMTAHLLSSALLSWTTVSFGCCFSLGVLQSYPMANSFSLKLSRLQHINR